MARGYGGSCGLTRILALIFLIVLLSCSPAVPAQQLQFYREDITFSLNHNAVETDATYHFCNVGDKEIKTQLFYPLPDKTMDQIDSLVIWDAGANTVLPYRKGHSGVFFPVTVNPFGQSAYRVYFQQWLTDRHYRYILTSTETWGRGLDFANYELRVPLEIKVDSLSIPPDTSYVKSDIQYFFWKKKDYMPKKDFEVWF